MIKRCVAVALYSYPRVSNSVRVSKNDLFHLIEVKKTKFKICKKMMHYTLIPHVNSHQWQIILEFSKNNENENLLKLANWVPGSYMIRDFSRHIMTIEAFLNGEKMTIEQVNKNTWKLPEKAGVYQIRYTVYANDLSVRASLLDNERGFFDGACLFLYRPDALNEPCLVQFKNLPETWDIQTMLPEKQCHRFQAANYWQLIDCPFEMGANIEVLHFEACGIPHRIALSGHYLDFDRQRLIDDCQRICAYEISLFPKPTPFKEYLFLLHLGDRIYGGLEHLNNTALHADRHSLPPRDMGAVNVAYAELLGLIAHEYFHAWNVKSMKPALFQPYDLDKEVYTEQLWAYEGITSYYDDLSLVRSGVISVEQYLQLLAQLITRVHRNAGRKKQTLAQSSFAAWHKYYKQDENSPNAITSYYQQGALMALCLDALIRQHSSNSLDTVMQRNYQHYVATGRGTDEKQWVQLVQQITGVDLDKFFQAALYSVEDLPLTECLASMGVELRWLPESRQQLGSLVTEFPVATPSADIACRFTQQPDTAVITHVFSQGAAEQAALKPNDRIVAVDGFACQDFLKQVQTNIGDRHQLHYFRHGVLQQTELIVQAANTETAYLKIINNEKLETWLLK